MTFGPIQYLTCCDMKTISFGCILHCVCFNLYCGGFILFCNVCVCVCVCVYVGVCVCVCMCGFCSVWVL